MCLWSMKMFGTERWEVISSRASWIAAPSSNRCAVRTSHIVPLAIRHYSPTWSSSMIYGFAPWSLSRDLVALQYGQYDLEKTAITLLISMLSLCCNCPSSFLPTALLSMISCAFCFAAMMVFGLAGRPLKKVRKKLMVAVVMEGGCREEEGCRCFLMFYRTQSCTDF